MTQKANKKDFKAIANKIAEKMESKYNARVADIWVTVSAGAIITFNLSYSTNTIDFGSILGMQAEINKVNGSVDFPRTGIVTLHIY